MSNTNQTDFSNLRALFVNCTLKPSPKRSHTAGLLQVSMDIMKREGVSLDSFRMVDHQVAPGVQPDMREHGFEQDAWPDLYQRVARADILVVGTPIWLGECSSEARKLVERLYSMSGKQNEKGQYLYYGKVGGCIITGNEDGVKHCAMSLLYALQHVGYTVPPQADAGWIGPIGPGPSYLDEESNAQNNDFTNRNTTFMTYNLLHLAQMLRAQSGIPAHGNVVSEWADGKRWAFQNPEYR